MLIFSYTNSSGVDLTVAYASILNPIQLANPVAAGNMPSCDALLHSAYSRRRLPIFPRIPHNYDVLCTLRYTLHNPPVTILIIP